MAKCRQLLQENEEIGKMITSGRLAKLEGELSMQKALCEEMKKNQIEMDDFVQELDDDMEGMQSTIYFLQQQLKDAKETIGNLEAEKAGNISQLSKDRSQEQELHKSNTLGGEEISKPDEQDHAEMEYEEDENTTDDKIAQMEDPTSRVKDCDTTADTIGKNYGEIPEESNSISGLGDNIDDKSSQRSDANVEEKPDNSETSPKLENVTESPILPRGTRGRRGTPTKLEKAESPLKGKGPQRTTRGQKRAATNLVGSDEKDEKDNEDEGTATTRPKRRRAAPQRFVTDEEGGKRKKTISEGEGAEEQDD